MGEGQNPGHDFEGRVRTALADLLCEDEGSLRPQALLLEDLNVDSLGFLALVTGLGRAFDVDIPDGEAARMKTVADVTETLRRCVGPAQREAVPA